MEAKNTQRSKVSPAREVSSVSELLSRLAEEASLARRPLSEKLSRQRTDRREEPKTEEQGREVSLGAL